MAFRNDCCEVDLVAIRFRQWKGRCGTDLFGKTLAIHGSTASHDGHCGFLCRFCNDSWNPAISLVSPSARALACADLHPCLCLCPLHGGDALHPRTEEAERALIASKPGAPTCSAFASSDEWAAARLLEVQDPEKRGYRKLRFPRPDRPGQVFENQTLREVRVSAETLGWIGKRKRVYLYRSLCASQQRSMSWAISPRLFYGHAEAQTVTVWISHGKFAQSPSLINRRGVNWRLWTQCRV